MTSRLGALAALLSLGMPGCHYDGPPEEGYRIEELEGRVRVCLETGTHRACPDAGLLREDPSSGDVVRITSCDGACFLDECVPAGEHRYGLAQPYVCDDEPGHPTRYYSPVRLAGAPEGCVRTAPPPTPDAGVPWPGTGVEYVCPGWGGPDVCPLACCSTGLGGGGAAALLLLALALRGARIGPRRPAP